MTYDTESASRRRSVGARTAALLAVLAVTACGASRPDPVRVAEPDPRPDSVRLAEVPPLRSDLEPMPFPVPPRPWLPPAIRWSPTGPREGEAVGLRVLQPEAGRGAVDVEGEIDGRPVHFTRVDGGWFGVAAAPIGSAGPAALELRFLLSPDSTAVERTTLEIGAREFPATRLSVAPRFSDPDPEALARIREERRLVRATLARATEEWLPRGAFRWPRETRITSPFGQRRLFNGELRSRHTGVDLAGRRGAPVLAAARGRVALSEHLYFAGNAVYVDHGLGVYTGYFHLSEIDVEEGDVLEKGDLVGKVGSTGRVTGPHLHWSLYVNGESLDASSLLHVDVPEADPGPGGSASPRDGGRSRR